MSDDGHEGTRTASGKRSLQPNTRLMRHTPASRHHTLPHPHLVVAAVHDDHGTPK